MVTRLNRRKTSVLTGIAASTSSCQPGSVCAGQPDHRAGPAEERPRLSASAIMTLTLRRRRERTLVRRVEG